LLEPKRDALSHQTVEIDGPFGLRLYQSRGRWQADAPIDFRSPRKRNVDGADDATSDQRIEPKECR